MIEQRLDFLAFTSPGHKDGALTADREEARTAVVVSNSQRRLRYY